jgi:GNAT superfamily N-acetyltransferase
MARLRAGVGETQWREAGIGVKPGDRDDVFVCVRDAEIVAAASYEIWDGRLAHLLVATAPSHRSKGYGRAVAAFAASHAIARNLLPQWRALESNEPSLRLAASLRFERAASHYTIELRPEAYPLSGGAG